MTAALCFVTVVYEPEMPLLRLQARSFALYLPPDDVGSVVVIDNSARGMGAGARRSMQAEYGVHSPRVRFLRPRQIARVPSTTGWLGQQVLKLAVADLVEEECYVVLDAKNHWVRPVGRDTFVGPDGRPKANVHGFEEHPLRNSLERVLDFVGLSAQEHLGQFTATVTPFVMRTADVRALLLDVGGRRGRGFADEFVDAGLTEFFLYTAWLLARGGDLDDHVDVPLGPVPLLWAGQAARDGSTATRAAVRGGRDPSAVCFAVHSRAFAHLAAEDIEVLAEFWVERGLAGDAHEVRSLVADVVRIRRRTRLRQRVGEVFTAARRARR